MSGRTVDICLSPLVVVHEVPGPQSPEVTVPVSKARVQDTRKKKKNRWLHYYFMCISLSQNVRWEAGATVVMSGELLSGVARRG